MGDTIFIATDRTEVPGEDDECCHETPYEELERRDRDMRVEPDDGLLHIREEEDDEPDEPDEIIHEGRLETVG